MTWFGLANAAKEINRQNKPVEIVFTIFKVDQLFCFISYITLGLTALYFYEYFSQGS